MNAEDPVITFKKNMASLSKTERRRAIESVRDVIRAALFDDATGSTYEVECCPRCGSVAIVKKGKSKNGEQRHLCRNCGRSFGMGSEHILGSSKLPKETWMAYAKCFVLKLPLRECARRCHVCLKTAYTMRHRLIECLSAYSPLVQGRAGPRPRARRDLSPRVVQGQPHEGIVHDAVSLPTSRQAGAQARAVARADLRHDRRE